MALGENDLFHGDRYKWGAQVTAINVTDKYALYNFLSTFSGTHYGHAARHHRPDHTVVLADGGGRRSLAGRLPPRVGGFYGLGPSVEAWKQKTRRPNPLEALGASSRPDPRAAGGGIRSVGGILGGHPSLRLSAESGGRQRARECIIANALIEIFGTANLRILGV